MYDVHRCTYEKDSTMVIVRKLLVYQWDTMGSVPCSTSEERIIDLDTLR
jgi:hypothetical protein